VTKPRIYVAGPMSGLPQLNYPAFHAAAAQLRALGFEVENPAENPEPPCKSWQGYMRMAVRQLALCDGVVFLPGWEESRGARAEARLAFDLMLDTCELARALNGWIPQAVLPELVDA
jgi:hypothetical protein